MTVDTDSTIVGTAADASYTINATHTVTLGSNDVTVTGDTTTPSDAALIVSAGGTLTSTTGSIITLTNANSSLQNSGSITNGGSIIANGTVANNAGGTIANSGTITFNASSIYTGGGKITNSATGVTTADVGTTGLAALVSSTTLTGGTFNFTTAAGGSSLALGTVAFSTTTPSTGAVAIGFGSTLGGDLTLTGAGTAAGFKLDGTTSIAYNITGTVNLGNATAGSLALRASDTMNVAAASTFTVASGSSITNAGAITNAGTMTFAAGSSYIPTTAPGTIANNSIITADIGIAGFKDLVNATAMRTGSRFNFATATAGRMNMNNVAFASGTGNVTLGFNPTGVGSSLTLLGDTTATGLGLGGTTGITYDINGAVALGRATSTLPGDTDPLLGTLTVRSGDKMTLTTGSFTVAAKGTNPNSGGVLNWMSGATMDLAAGTTLNLNGVLDLTKPDPAVLGSYYDANTMSINGTARAETVTLGGGMLKLYTTGTDFDMSRIIATDINNFTLTGETKVRVYGATANANRNGGDVAGAGIIWGISAAQDLKNLKSNLYSFQYGTGGGAGTGAIVIAAKYYGDAFAGSGLGQVSQGLGGAMSVNKAAVANYIDYILNDGGGNKTSAGNAGYFYSPDSAGVRLVDFLEGLEVSDPGQLSVLVSQVAGEYATNATVAVQNSSSAIFSNFNDRFREAMNSRLFSDSGFASSEAYAAAPTSRSTSRSAYRRPAANTTALTPSTPNRVWGGGFGNWAKQNSTDNISGWKYDSGGFVLGYERQIGNFTVGAAGSWTHGRTRVNDLSTSIGSDIVDLGVYGGYTSPVGWFVNGRMGFGYGWNDYNVGTVVGSKHGKYDSSTFSIAADAGYVFKVSMLNIIPSFGVHYTHLRNNGWTESSTGPILGNWFSSENYNFVRLPLAVRVNSVIQLGNGACIIPEFRAAWTYSANDERAQIRTGFAGAGGGITVLGPDSGRNQGLLGVGVKAKLRSNVDIGLDYNFEFRNRYQNHNVLARVGVSF